jgi:hypothetical protein
MTNRAPFGVVHERHTGDTRTLLTCRLWQRDTGGVLTKVSATSFTELRFRMVDDDGTTVIAETTDNVGTAADPDDVGNTVATYAFQAADVATAGRFRGYFAGYTGTARDSFPAARGELIIEIEGD